MLVALSTAGLPPAREGGQVTSTNGQHLFTEAMAQVCQVLGGAAEADDPESIRNRRDHRVGEVSYKGHQYPAEIIAHCVWLYHRLPLSFREVEELMLDAA